MKNIEIEQRFITDQSTILMDWLATNATFIARKHYYDIYYQNDKNPFIISDEQGIKDAHEWLRIRQYDGVAKLCYKCWHRNLLTDMPLYADQIELSIDSFENMKQLLQRIGYYSIAEIYRWRSSWLFGDYRIVQDEVEKLGIFYEIEYRGVIENPHIVMETINNLLINIGIQNFKIIDKGYPWMYWNSNWKSILGTD